MFEILSTFETGPEIVPPIDRFAAGFRTAPENVVALLRMTAEQGLLVDSQGRQDCGIKFSITEKGKHRLELLKRIRSG